MRPAMMRALAAERGGQVAAMAESALEGDEVGVLALTDYCEEEGIEMASDRVLKIGSNVAIITMTYLYVGRVVERNHSEIILDDAACVYDTGRFNEFLATGKPAVAEAFLDPIGVGRDNVVAYTPWRHALIRKSYPDESNG